MNVNFKRHPGLPGPPLPRLIVNVSFCTLQLTCSCHSCWPSSFLPTRVSSKRAQSRLQQWSRYFRNLSVMSSSKSRYCIWNKCARNHFKSFFRELSVCCLTFYALRVINMKFLFIISMLYKTECSRELPEYMNQRRWV